MSAFKLENISKTYEGFQLDQIDLEMESGEIIALVGESGSGKSTLLRIIAGLERADQGSIYLGEEIWQNSQVFKEANERSIGFVFQDYALFPHLNVEDNICFALKKKNKQFLNSLLEMVGLLGYEKKAIHELSGGEQQRVALARSMALAPQLMLLDEPFSNLDTLLKKQMRKEIKRILKENRQSSVIVTHDLEDAYEIADRIAVMKDGVLLQFSKAEELYVYPVNDYVAGLTGVYSRMNINGQESIIRPEHITIDGQGVYRGEITKKSFKGSHYELELKVDENIIFVKLGLDSKENIGDYVNFNIDKK